MPGIFTSNEEKKLNKTTLKVLETIHSKWPTNPLEVAKELDEKNKNVKLLSARYLYHFKKLHNLELIHLKKTGNTYIAWPADIEKLRVLHEMVREE